MNLVVLGIFSFNVYGIQGAIFQSISHGFVASALFLCIGVVYERYKTRIVKYYGGLVLTMPLYIVICCLYLGLRPPPQSPARPPENETLAYPAMIKILI